MRYTPISSLGPIRHRLMTGLLLTLVAAAALLIGPLVRPQFTSAANVRMPPPACANGTVVTAPADHPGLVRDCEILLGLRDALAGNATLNWSVTLPITQWEGIIVDRRNGNVPLRVTALKLRDRGLDGTLPPALGGLSGLQVLWLSLNQLTGSIPPELGNITMLTELRLAGNQLSGSIPAELAAIGPQLERLDLSGPQPLPSGIGLTGRIPPQLSNLSGLQSLHLEGNRLSGPIPTRLGQLTNLRRFAPASQSVERGDPDPAGRADHAGRTEVGRQPVGECDSDAAHQPATPTALSDGQHDHGLSVLLAGSGLSCSTATWRGSTCRTAWGPSRRRRRRRCRPTR